MLLTNKDWQEEDQLSFEATDYVKALQVCEDGAPLTSTHKLVLLMVADYHSFKHRLAWPSKARLAYEGRTSLPTIKRALDYLEAHGVIVQHQPTGHGPGQSCSYTFAALEGPKRLTRKLEETLRQKSDAPACVPSGPDGNSKTSTVAFSAGEEKGLSEGHVNAEMGPGWVQNAWELGSRGVQFPKCNKERTKEPLNHEPTSTQNSTLAVKENRGSKCPEASAALKVWVEVKSQLRAELGENAWTWLRPALLLAVMSDKCLLIALPPNRAIAEAARNARPQIHAALCPRGWALAGFTKYPDEYERERIRAEFPDFYLQLFGNWETETGRTQAMPVVRQGSRFVQTSANDCSRSEKRDCDGLSGRLCTHSIAAQGRDV